MKSTILVGLQHGDEGKGKVAFHWMRQNPEIHWCIRFNGGPNAGHSIHWEGKHYNLHQVPTGALLPDIQCVIGPGCVVHLDKLIQEVEELKRQGIYVEDRLYLSSQAHLITDGHIQEDTLTNTIGTTGSGIGPAYADKAYRRGKRIGDLEHPPFKVVDMYELLRSIWNFPNAGVFWEGAQGLELDISWGTYPYVTSSPCVSAGACLSGAPFSSIECVIGAAKVYETYLGTKEFQPEGELPLQQIQQLGKEVGNTTGRIRQCNYIHLQRLVRALWLNSVQVLILNKGDILQEAGVYKYYDLQGTLQTVNTWREFKETVENEILSVFPELNEIFWSCSPTEL
jgi:adenylosuccinate synthase